MDARTETEASYREWLEHVPEAFKQDSLWQMQAYRLALFAADRCWSDVAILVKDPRTRDLVAQVYEAVGSIGANTAEGYSRGTGKDRARFYEYALGSARESRHRYFMVRHVLGEAVAAKRFNLLAEIIRLLLTMIPDQRAWTVREPEAEYTPNPDW